MNEYNTVSPSKHPGCPGTYSNHLVTETFTRSNCGSTYSGGDITFSVPAAKYTSSRSQADADAQAEAALLTHRQTYADAHGASNDLRNDLLSINAKQGFG